MGRPCRWCGKVFNSEEKVRDHEVIHRDIEHWTRLEQNGADSEQYWSIEDSQHVNDNVDARFQCKTCGKSFAWKNGLNKHIVAEHQQMKHDCIKCRKPFKYLFSKLRHERTCKGETEHKCHICGKLCSTAHGLRRHTQSHKKEPVRKEKRSKRRVREDSPLPSTSTMTRPRRYHCRRCSKVYDDRSSLFLHGIQEHYNMHGGGLQPRPWTSNDDAPWGGDDALRRIYEANAPLILENHRRGPIRSVFNFPLTNEVDVEQIVGFVDNIYRQQDRAFRLNIVFGVILQHRETGRYRYFVPYNNNGIFERPFFVSNRNDVQRIRGELESTDILEELLTRRPDTKWLPVLITNVHLIVYETFYPLGQGYLPDYLMKKDSLYPLVKNHNNSVPYEDNLCAFRCLALHNGYDIKSIEGPSTRYFRQWTAESKEEFKGVAFNEFPRFEELFRVNLEVYSLEEDGFARSIYKSRGRNPTSMYVNMYKNHLSYIRCFASFAEKYQCKTCDRHFNRAGNLHRHQNCCSDKTRFVYPGGFHQAWENIFEKLDQYEIHVPEDERTFPWVICYDYEAILQKVQEKATEMLQWTHQHVPVSVSICSNVEGYTDPICIVEGNQDQLVRKMVEHMNEIALRVYELASEKWGWVLDAINDKLRHEDDNLEWIRKDDDGDDVKRGIEDDREPKLESHPLKKVYGHMETYMTQVPVLGFNSAKYDLNVIKKCLAKHLSMHEDSHSFVVKKCNAYTCITTENLKFLDMAQYLAAGSSYAGFLKAYGVTEQKGYFCYEWFDSFEKLNYPSLPPYEDFYSQLKGCNISSDEYEYCQKVWKDQKMINFRDFLIWYNNLDVTGFVDAVEKFQKFYFDKGIDVFKTSISVPGIARQILFKTAKSQNVNFALFDNHNKDLYQTIKRNIIGGPSIIFTRHHCAGKTLIRGKKRCQSVLGFDANALYLHAIDQPMPVGPFVRRLARNNFRPELRDKYMSAYYWMDWLIHHEGLNIQHKLNTGREVRVGQYPVDGYVPASRPDEKPIVLQFQGCYWHGHLCDETAGINDEKWQSIRKEKYRKTQETTAYLKRDHRVIEIWGCQFRKYCEQNPQIYDFIDSQRPGFFREQRGKGNISADLILQGVENGILFGMVELDIEVPLNWTTRFQHPSMTPYEYFSEMSPLFCTTDIPFEAIGEHIQDHIRSHRLSEKPRRLLVGGMRARQILLATPLLRWYLNHGLKVTKVYQVVEFKSQRCFRHFVREVSDARRQGDLNPDTAIIADTMKVIGNSAYGSLIMDKTKHSQVQYIQGENEVCLKVNDPLFHKLDCLNEEDQYYEIEMAKRKIKLDLPIQLGYFILQYAKLRMLEFYYDFMDICVDRSDFEYCETDTDSAYLAISGRNLNGVIRPETRDKYEKGLTGYCSDVEIEADAKDHWFPRTCCSKHAKIDKRTPGLFKLEYQGDEMIGLCSKTYIIRKVKLSSPSSTQMAAIRLLNKARRQKPRRRTHLAPRRFNEYKFSSKGISKRHLKAPMVKFRRVLMSSRPESGVNRGFRVRNNTIFTYTQERRGFSYLYCKRKVLDDGIHTIPLDITLCPLSPQDRDDDDQELINMLSNNFEN